MHVCFDTVGWAAGRASGLGFTFLVPADLGSLGKRAVKRVRVCVLEHSNSRFESIRFVMQSIRIDSFS